MNENQRVRIIVICGDTISFGSWGTRTGDDQKHFSSFMSPLVELFKAVREKQGCFLSQVADGFVAVFEMQEGHNCATAIKVLKMAVCINKKVRKILARMNHPKPTGFRLRINCGWGWKWDLGGYKNFDYFSPTINTTHKLLRVNKTTPIICHESIKELMSFKQIKKSGIKMKKVLEVDSTPIGVNQEDMDLLWEISGKKIVALFVGKWSISYTKQIQWTGYRKEKNQMIKIYRPVASEFEISSPYGERTHPVTGKINSFHYGIDFKVPKGTPVVASVTGPIVLAGWEDPLNEFKGFGLRIWQKDVNLDLFVVYGHLSELAVQEEQHIIAGTRLGLSGNTGGSSGPHLHLEAREQGIAGKKGVAFDFHV